jgi:hypothetical protein
VRRRERVDEMERMKTCLFRTARGFVLAAEVSAGWVKEETEGNETSVAKVAIEVCHKPWSVSGGRREVRTEPIEEMIISAYRYQRLPQQPPELTGPIHNINRMPKLQNPQFFIIPTAVHVTSLPLSIASASSRPASGPPISSGVCSSRCNSWPIGLGGTVPSDCAGSGATVGKTFIKHAPKRLMMGERIPRKTMYLTAFSSGLAWAERVEKYGREEKDARKREERPMNESGMERASVGYAGNEREAVTS